MSVTNTSNKAVYNGDGSTVNWPYTFPIVATAAGADVLVFLQDTTGAVTAASPSDYTVDTANSRVVYPKSGSSQPVLPSGWKIAIVRVELLKQLGGWTDEGPFLPSTFEGAFDFLTYIAQQIDEKLSRAIKLPESETAADAATRIPYSTGRANKVLGFDASGNPIALSNVPTSGVAASTYIQTLLDDVDAATARGTLGFSASGGKVQKGLLDPATTTDPLERANYSIVASVSGNALTVSLKTKAGNDPSANEPVTIAFRHGTLANGTYVTRTITGPLSITVSSGSTLGQASSQPQFIHVYLIDNAGTVELAVSTQRIFDEGTLQNTTAEGGAGAADSANVLYSTTSRSSAPVRLIGRILSTQATAGTWAAAPSEIALVTSLQAKQQRSYVVCDTGNGFGGTNTKIRRFANSTSVGAAITYADSAANGGSFTINEDGLYSIHYSDASTGNDALGLSLNSSNNTTNINILTVAQGKIAVSGITSTDTFGQVSTTIYLRAGDVIRAHCNPSAFTSTDTTQFRIIKIAD